MSFLEIFIETKTKQSKFVLIIFNDLDIEMLKCNIEHINLNKQNMFCTRKCSCTVWTIIEWNFAKLQQLRTYRWTFSTFINATLYFFLSCTIIINIALFWMEQINDLSYMCVFCTKEKMYNLPLYQQLFKEHFCYYCFEGLLTNMCTRKIQPVNNIR